MIFLKLQLSHLPWVGPQSHSEQLFIGRDRQGRLTLHNETSAASEANNQGIPVDIYRKKWELDVLELHTHTQMFPMTQIL